MDTIDTMLPARQSGLTRRAGFGRGVAWIAGAALGLLLTWQQRARERHILAGLDEHMLRDLGLSRADVASEVRKPFWRA